MDTHKKLREHISALADGELPESERELALAALSTPEGRAAWQAYQLAGDALRAAPGAELGGGFQSRLAERLALEPAFATTLEEPVSAIIAP